ncbi:MAG TPA: hypothetical protein VII99_05795 [Bacteroidia bacterium]
MSKYRFFILWLSILGIVAVQSCKKKKDDKDQVKISSAGSAQSHNTGQNCMNCHKSGEDDTGTFTVAGSVYDSSNTAVYSNAIIKLFTQPHGAGQLRATINGDVIGNFYTTSSIDFSGGVYPAVTGSSGITKYMSASITSGACNGCHGSSTSKIWIK